jgi:hypothetical protein
MTTGVAVEVAAGDGINEGVVAYAVNVFATAL